MNRMNAREINKSFIDIDNSFVEKRLQKEYKAILKNPVEHIEAHPSPENIREWHYAIYGPEDTPYYGGVYWGKLVFPSDYPMKPPSILMLTPNGRFKTAQRLCLSMSDFHPETWNPLWSVSSILTGLLSFMCEERSTLGSIETSPQRREQLALQSMDYNKTQAMFRQLFANIIADYDNRQGYFRKAAPHAATSSTLSAPATPSRIGRFDNTRSTPLADAITYLLLAVALAVALKFFWV